MNSLGTTGALRVQLQVGITIPNCGRLFRKYITHWSKVLCKKLIVLQSRNFHVLWNLKIYYCVLKSVPIQNQMNLVHTIPSEFCKICFDIILQSVPRSSVQLFCFCIFDRNHVDIFLELTLHCCTCLFLLDFLTLTVSGKEYTS